MSLVPVLVTILLLGGLAVAVRVWAEQRARLEAAARAAALEERVRELDVLVRRAGEHEREWLAVLAHELRSPTGAVLGYAELIRDGTLGSVDAGVADAVVRMGRAAEQILTLIGGLEDIALINDDQAVEPELLSARDLLTEAAELLGFDAEARRARIHVAGADVPLCTRRDDAARGVRLALGAAIKVSAGRALSLAASRSADDTVTLTISGTGLAPDADDPARQATGRSLSGAGFRIALARSTLTRCRGVLDIHPADDGADLVLTLPDMALPGSPEG